MPELSEELVSAPKSMPRSSRLPRSIPESPVLPRLLRPPRSLPESPVLPRSLRPAKSAAELSEELVSAPKSMPRSLRPPKSKPKSSSSVIKRESSELSELGAATSGISSKEGMSSE